MSEIRMIKVNKMMPAVKELLTAGKRVRITVTGMSMYPFLRGNIDSVELVHTGFSEVRQGDILLVNRENGEYVLHRVIRKKKEFLHLNGDAQQWCEIIYPEQIIAKVINVWRKDKSISCSNLKWRALSYLWQMVFPLRYFIINLYKVVFRRLKLFLK